MYTSPLLKAFGLLLFMIVIFAIAYADNGPLTLIKFLKCKFGLHKLYIGYGKNKIIKYYCQICKKPRNSPKLSVIEGGNIFNQHKYLEGDKNGKRE